MKKLRFLVPLLLCLLLIGCTAKESPVPAESTASETTVPVTEEPEVLTYQSLTRTDLEFRGSGRIFPIEAQVTSRNGCTYCFTPKITEDRRAAFIAAQETLNALLEQTGISPELKTIGVLVSYDSWAYSEKSTLYLDVDAAETWEQVLFTLQAVMGEYSNYGYLYALSNHLARELGWETDPLPDAALSELSASPYLLDLVYPCFDPEFVTDDQIAISKSLAVALFETLEDPFCQEAFLLAREQYAETSGIEYTPVSMAFASAGKSCPLKIRTPYFDLLRYDDYDCAEDYKNHFADYPTMVSDLTWLTDCIAHAADLFGVEEVPSIDVRLSGSAMDRYPGFGGQFVPGSTEPYIDMKKLCVIVHEYIHYLYYLSVDTSDPETYSWQNEAIAYYFGMLGENFVCAANYQEGAPYEEAYRQVIGHTYADPSDALYLLHLDILNEERSPIDLLTDGTRACGSFGLYFVQEYGEALFIQAMLQPSRVEELTGSTMEAIKQGWQEMIFALRENTLPLDQVITLP